MNTYKGQQTSSGKVVTITTKEIKGWWYYKINNEKWHDSGYVHEKDAITMAKSNN